MHYGALRPAFQAIADDLGVTLDFTAKVASLTVGKQQQLELIKALFQRPRLLILDEPTAVLAPAERAKLMAIVQTSKRRHSAIPISHKLDDLYACCDRASRHATWQVRSAKYRRHVRNSKTIWSR